MGLVHTWLRDACPSIHKARLSAVGKVVHGLLAGGRLTLTELGGQVQSSAFAPPTLKGVERRLGNLHLQHARVAISRAVARGVLAHTPRPVLRVAWSQCEPGPKPLRRKAG
jgi:hypothetical protein